MKKLKTYEGFFSHKSDIDKNLDKQVNDIFEEIKATFNPESLSGGDDRVTYNLDGTIIYIRDNDSQQPFNFGLDYELYISKKEIECSNSLKRKIFKFLIKKCEEIYDSEKLKEKEEQLQVLSPENRMGKKYNI